MTTTPNRGYQLPVFTSLGTSFTLIGATFGMIDGDVAELFSQVVEKAPLLSPEFTGTPRAPTPAPDGADDVIATLGALRSAIETFSPGNVNAASITTGTLPDERLSFAVSSFIRTLLDDNSAADARSTLGIYSQTQVDDAVTAAVAAAVPPGTVVDFAGTAAPDGWLLCFGQAVSRSTYAALFAKIGTAHGVGNGTTTFNLPDLRGRVTAGKDNMGGTSANRLTALSGGLNGDNLGEAGGAESHTLLVAQLPSHNHGVGTLATSSAGAHVHAVAFNQSNANGNSALGGTNTAANETMTGAAQSAGAHTHAVTGSTASNGSGEAHNNVQPTLILNKIIKT
jgi:microcystin-dependent protein